jgi:RNA recognition motif-containing protein
MAAITEMATDSNDVINDGGTGDGIEKSTDSKPEIESDDLKPKSKPEYDQMKKLVAMFKKLNPEAKEFFPSYKRNTNQSDDFVIAIKPSGEDNKKVAINRRRRNNYNQGRRVRLPGRASKAQREDSIRRTVYVSDIDQSVTEEGLAGLFSSCGQVVDCRICGDPNSVLRFAFVEFSDDQGARSALSLGGTMIGYYPVRVLPSKTAILPVNPTFLPRVKNKKFHFSQPA